MKAIPFNQAQTAALRWFDRIAAALSLLLLISAYYLLLNLKIFGHDEVHYYHDFTFKLKEEGRWINFLLHHWLRQVPLAIHAVLFVCGSWLVLFRIAKNLTRDIGYSVVIASVLLLSPPYIEQSLWPATLLPTTLALLALSWLADKGVSHKVIYPFGGVLLFGMMQNCYFLLPLFFLRRKELEHKDIDKLGSYLFSHLFYWISGAIAGALFSSAAVFIATGQAGIVPAEWRHTAPVHDLKSLARNMLYVIESFKRQAYQLWKSGSGNSPVYISGLILLCAFRLQFWRSDFSRILILLAVGAAFFAFSVPLAPVIQTRSLIALSVAMLLVLLVSNQPPLRIHWLSIILLLWTGWNLSINGRSYLSVHKTRAEFVMRKMQSVLPDHPSSYETVAIFGQMDKRYREAQIFNSPPYARSIAFASGVKDYWDCRTSSKECDMLARKFSLASRSINQAIEFIGTSDNVAVILLGGGAVRYKPTDASSHR
jgi:hypothetical protein